MTKLGNSARTVSPRETEAAVRRRGAVASVTGTNAPAAGPNDLARASSSRYVIFAKRGPNGGPLGGSKRLNVPRSGIARWSASLRDCYLPLLTNYLR